MRKVFGRFIVFCKQFFCILYYNCGAYLLHTHHIICSLQGAFLLITGMTRSRGFDNGMGRSPGSESDSRGGTENRNSREVTSGGDMERAGIVGDKESAVIEEGGKLEEREIAGEDEDAAHISDKV